MGTTEWTIIATAIALFVALGSLIRFSNEGAKNELKGDIANVRAEIANLRTELKGDMAELRTELKLDFQSNRAEIITNLRMLGRFALHRHGEDGLPLAPLTDALEPPDGSGDPPGADTGNN